MKGDKCKLGCKYNIRNICHDINTPSYISCGKVKEEKTISKKSERTIKSLSEEQIKAYNYSIKGKSLSWIGKKIKRAKSTVHEYIKKVERVYKEDKGVANPNDKGYVNIPNDLSCSGLKKRVHNDVVSFLINPVDLSMVKDRVKLKYSCYVLDKRDKNFHIQIWSKKIIVRFKKDIEGVDLVSVKKKANKRIRDFLESYNYKGVVFLDGKAEQVSRHYAILSTGFAKRIVREGRKLFIFDSKRRLRGWVDNSHGNPELELGDKELGFDDTVTADSFMGDMLEKVGYYDLPSVTKSKIDVIIGVQERYAKNIELHLKVEEKKLEVEKTALKVNKETLKTLRAIQRSLKK